MQKGWRKSVRMPLGITKNQHNIVATYLKDGFHFQLFMHELAYIEVRVEWTIMELTIIEIK